MAVLRTATAGQSCGRRRIPFALVLFAAAAAGLLPARNAKAQAGPNEYEVKAAYILNFARFIDWPPLILPPSSPLTIAIVGNDPFGGTLEILLRGKSANGHPLRIRYLRWNDTLTKSQIIFICASEEPHLPEIMRLLGHASVLTVSDIDRFSLRGGVIEFRLIGNRVRFDINRTPAIESQLTISSKLLSVARAVHGGPGQ